MQSRFLRGLLILGAGVGLLACSLATPNQGGGDATTISGAPVVRLASPLENATYRENVPVNILAQVSNAGPNIERVEVLVDNIIIATLPNPNPTGADAFSVAQAWPAAGLGTHTIGVNAFRGDGTGSEPVAVTVTVVDVSGSDGTTVLASDDGAAAGAGEDTGDTRQGIGNLLGAIVGGGGQSAQQAEATEVPQPTALLPEPEPDEPDDEVEAQQAEAPANEPEQAEEAVAPPPTPSQPMARLTVGANIRSGPSTSYVPAIGSLPAGEETPLLAVNSDRSWYKIQYYNSEGWIFGQLIDVVGDASGLPVENPPPPPPTSTPVPTAVPATEAPAAPAQTGNINVDFNRDPRIDPFPPDCGQTMTINIRYENNGPDPMPGSAAVVVRDVHPDSGTVTETRGPLEDLGGYAIAEVEVFLTVDTNFNSDHYIEVILDADGQISENDEDDNRFRTDDYELDDGDRC